MEALQLWVRYPKQTATGLRNEYPGAHIRQWHQGEMSSREFLELIEGLSPESWFKQSLRRDLELAEVSDERDQMFASHRKIRSLLMGEEHIAHDMTFSPVEKHGLTRE